jgi:CBS domain-containing protein
MISPSIGLRWYNPSNILNLSVGDKLSNKPRGILHQTFIETQLSKLLHGAAITVREDESVDAVLRKMQSAKVGCMLVSNQQGQPIGIFTERDIVLRVWSSQIPLSTLDVKGVMTANPQTLKYNASIGRALYLMSVGGFRHIPVQHKDGSWGILSVRDFIKYLYQATSAGLSREEQGVKVFAKGETADEFLTGEISAANPSPAVVVRETATVEEAVAQLRQHSIGCVVVVGEKSSSVRGIFTERDLLMRAILQPREQRVLPISEFMTPTPVTLLPTTSILFALQAMSERSFRHMPIVDFEERLVGVLSIKDFVKTLSDGVIESLSRKASK